MTISSGVLLTLLSLAAIGDVALRRIPNGLLILGWMIGMCFNPELSYVAKSVLAIIVFYPAWRMKLIGAGDVKLLAVIMGWLEMRILPEYLLCFALAAGGLGLLITVHDRVSFRMKRTSIPLASAMWAGYVLFLFIYGS